LTQYEGADDRQQLKWQHACQHTNHAQWQLSVRPQPQQAEHRAAHGRPDNRAPAPEAARGHRQRDTPHQGRKAKHGAARRRARVAREQHRRRQWRAEQWPVDAEPVQVGVLQDGPGQGHLRRWQMLHGAAGHVFQVHGYLRTGVQRRRAAE